MKIEKIYSKLERVDFTFSKTDLQNLMRTKIERDYPEVVSSGKGIYRVPDFDWGDDENDNPYCIIHYMIETEVNDGNNLRS